MKKSIAAYWFAAIASLPLMVYLFDGEINVAVVISVLVGLVAWFVTNVLEAGAHA